MVYDCTGYGAILHNIIIHITTPSFLHARLRTSTLRSDYEGQSTILNLLLRNYLHYNLYDQADKLVSKSTFPDTASNNEWARFLYYLGTSSSVIPCLPSWSPQTLSSVLSVMQTVKLQ